jgi:hypothetical protein
VVGSPHFGAYVTPKIGAPMKRPPCPPTGSKARRCTPGAERLLVAVGDLRSSRTAIGPIIGEGHNRDCVSGLTKSDDRTRAPPRTRTIGTAHYSITVKGRCDAGLLETRIVGIAGQGADEKRGRSRVGSLGCFRGGGDRPLRRSVTGLTGSRQGDHLVSGARSARGHGVKRSGPVVPRRRANPSFNDHQSITSGLIAPRRSVGPDSCRSRQARKS